jgi:SAM-dependent methyltransferase
MRAMQAIVSRLTFRPPFDPEHATIDKFVRLASELTQPGAKLLDAGAGDSPYRKYFEHTRYISVDTASTGHHAFQSVGVRADLAALPFVSDTFDVVLCTQVLEHVRHPGHVLAELARVLKPKGNLFLTVPQSWEVHEAPQDYFRFTRYGLELLFNNAALEMVAIRPRGGYFYFMADRVGQLPTYLRGGLWTSPLARRVLRILFQRLLVKLLASLDHLDTDQRETLGYECIGTKSSAHTQSDHRSS